MKTYKYSLVLAFIFSAAMIFNGCATTKTEELIETEYDLGTAIRNSAAEINASLPQGTKIAVVNFTSTSTALSEYVLEELSLALTGGKKLVVVNRRELDLLRNELKFQLSGEVDDNTISSIGRISGAQFIITGSLVDAGIHYRFRAAAVNVQDAATEAPVSLAISKSDRQVSHFLNSGSPVKNDSPAANSPAANPLLGYWVWKDEAITFLFLPDNKLQIFEDGKELVSGTYDDKKFHGPDFGDFEDDLSYEFDGERVILTEYIHWDMDDPNDDTEKKHPLYKADSPYKSAPQPQADAPAAGMDLDAAIIEAAAHMEAEIPRGTKIALVRVSSSSARFSEYVITMLEAALKAGKKLVVVDRRNLDKVRAEQRVQLSSEVDDESAMSIGHLLGAGVIVTGTFRNLGDVYGLTLSVTDVDTAMRLIANTANIAKSARIEAMLAK